MAETSNKTFAQHSRCVIPTTVRIHFPRDLVVRYGNVESLFGVLTRRQWDNGLIAHQIAAQS